jgi:hypothetical protein
MFSLQESYRDPLPIFNSLFIFLLLIFKSSLCILDISTSQLYDYQIFSPNLACVFHFIDGIL